MAILEMVVAALFGIGTIIFFKQSCIPQDRNEPPMDIYDWLGSYNEKTERANALTEVGIHKSIQTEERESDEMTQKSTQTNKIEYDEMIQTQINEIESDESIAYLGRVVMIEERDITSVESSGYCTIDFKKML
jgi:hypothetical protein